MASTARNAVLAGPRLPSSSAPFNMRSVRPLRSRRPAISTTSTSHSPAPSTTHTCDPEATTQTSKPPAHSAPQVVVVGGGPAGLATALMLARRGWKDIVVLEPTSGVPEVTNKGYLYSIDARGQQGTELLGLTETLKEKGLDWTGGVQINRVTTKGELKQFKFEIPGTRYWLPRNGFIEVLQAGVDAHAGSLQVLHKAKCSEVRRAADGTVQVVASLADGTDVVYEPSLLVGADGLNSTVRQALEQWDPRFKVQAFDSASAGLKYKVMQLQPNPCLNKEGTLTITNERVATVLGNDGLRMGLLPLKDPSARRTGNIILRPEHPFWQVKSVDQLYEYLESAFPQLPLRDLLSEDKAREFVEAREGVFPKPQICGAMQLVTRPGSQSGEQAQASSGAQAVLLVGDAVHCFPPDLGQGVNSALEDVVQLNKALDECQDNLEQALPLFEKKRIPDVRALIKIQQFGMPYQYGQASYQAPLMDRVGQLMWTVDFFARTILNKVLPFIFSPPLITRISNPQFSYSQLLAMHDKSTMIIRSMLAVVGVAAAVLLTGRLA